MCMYMYEYAYSLLLPTFLGYRCQNVKRLAILRQRSQSTVPFATGGAYVPIKAAN